MSSGQWKSIELYPYDLTFNDFNQAQYFPCHFCGAPATLVVRRESAMTDNVYDSFVCPECARQWQRNADELPSPNTERVVEILRRI